MDKIEVGNTTLINGEALEVLQTLNSNSIDCVITSPPYWGLRDYFEEKQLGLEAHFNLYIDRLCGIFDEVHRVLKDEGTVWVVIGDTYSTQSGGNFENDNISNKSKGEVSNSTGINRANSLRGQKNLNYPDKCLCCIPDRFKIEMINRGWICRSEIIWHKRNVFPTSTRDRFTVDFEKVFFFVKNKKYYFETQYEPMSPVSDAVYRKMLRKNKEYNTKEPYKNNTPYKHNEARIRSQESPNRMWLDSSSLEEQMSHGRIKRCVWNINTKPSKENHYASYPEELIVSPIKAGCPEGGVVLDLFIGSGTTGVVCARLNRKCIGIDLNKEYIEISKKRIERETQQSRLF